jgi:EmrB/QacA subfamily drug resistance transporter
MPAAMPDTEPQHPSFTPAEIASVMTGLMLAMFLASLDQTVVATALPAMARDLDGWSLMPWVVSAYLVASTTTTPIYGRLSDLYGRRPVLLVSIALFVGSSILCALAPTMPLLIGARILQGLGGGGLRSVSQAVVADMIPPRERGRYQGYFSSVFGISNTLGPVLGGFLADYLSWHWIFWLNVPLGVAAFLLSWHHLRRLRVPTAKPVIDWPGAALIVASATPILIGVGNVERAGGWASPEAFGPVALGAAMIVLLVLRERVAPQPMLPLRLFANGIFSVASLVTFLTSMTTIGLVILVPINYQLAGNLAANQAGARLIPVTAGMVLGSFIAGQLLSRTGRYRVFPIVGTSTAALVCLAVAYVGLGKHLAFDLAATGLLGLALGCQLAPLTVTVQNALDWRDAGIGLSCLMFFRLMGGAFGVALLGTVLVASLNAGVAAIPGHEVLGANPGLALFHIHDGPALPPEFLGALNGVMSRAFSHVFLATAIVLAAAAIAALALREIPLRGRDAAR